MAESEVARLLQQFRDEEQAAKRGLSGYATASRHDFITARMENMNRCIEELAQVTGSETAALDLLLADQLQQDGLSPHDGT